MKINIYIYVNQLLLKPVSPSGEFESLRQEAVSKCGSASPHASLSLQAVMVMVYGYACSLDMWFCTAYLILKNLGIENSPTHGPIT